MSLVCHRGVVPSISWSVLTAFQTSCPRGMSLNTHPDNHLGVKSWRASSKANREATSFKQVPFSFRVTVPRSTHNACPACEVCPHGFSESCSVNTMSPRPSLRLAVFWTSCISFFRSESSCWWWSFGHALFQCWRCSTTKNCLLLPFPRLVCSSCGSRQRAVLHRLESHFLGFGFHHPIDGCEAARWPHQIFDQAGALVEKTLLGLILICVLFCDHLLEVDLRIHGILLRTLKSFLRVLAGVSGHVLRWSKLFSIAQFHDPVAGPTGSLLARSNITFLNFHISAFEFQHNLQRTVESDSHQQRIETYVSTRRDRDHNQLRRKPRISHEAMREQIIKKDGSLDVKD